LANAICNCFSTAGPSTTTYRSPNLWWSDKVYNQWYDLLGILLLIVFLKFIEIQRILTHLFFSAFYLILILLSQLIHFLPMSLF